MDTCTWSDVYNLISCAHDIFVMFDNYDSISEIDELPKIVYEKPAVSRMETNRRFIKYISNTLQSCTYLCGQPYSLRLSS